MKRIWLYLLGLVMLAACSDEIPEKPTPEVKPAEERTVMSYMVASDLGNYMKYNLIDMYKGLSLRKEKTTLLVFYSPSSYDEDLDGPTILKFVADGKGKINGKNPIPFAELEIKDKDRCSDAPAKVDPIIKQAELFPSKNADENAVDPLVMQRVIKEMTELAPSQSYGLLMGSHGTGWLPGKPVNGRSFGEEGGKNIDVPELAITLQKAFAGKKLDYILFDACMMSNAEVAYELRDVTDYMIASVLESPALGFPYFSFFDALYEDEVDYQYICDQYVKTNIELNSWGTCAVVDCKQTEALAGWVKNALVANAEGLTKDFPAKVIQYGRAPSFNNFSFDLVDVFRQLTGKESAELNQLMRKVVIAKNCIENKPSNFPYVTVDKNRYCGLGMYIPFITGDKLINNVSWDEFYIESFGWSKAVAWKNFKN